MAGELASAGGGVLEPIQTGTSLQGQLEELKIILENHGTPTRDPDRAFVGGSQGEQAQ